MGGFSGRHAVPHVALDIFDDHNRVVDHDADSQHQPEQGQVVDRNPERREDRERADERDRNGDHRNNRRPPRLQEQEDHAHDQNDRDEDREDDLVDGFADEVGRIVDALIVQSGRKALSELIHLVENFMLDGERVGAWFGEDRQRRRRRLISES